MTVRLVNPSVQLRLPAYLMAVSFAFGLLVVTHTLFAYREIFATTMVDVPDSYVTLIKDQTSDFMVVTSTLLVAYVLAVLAVCVAYLLKVVGPVLAFRRQIHALKRGDYTARNHLRRNDPFPELGRELNELATALETRRANRLLGR